MNIAKLIAKFVKKGFGSLSADEVNLLKENKSLMSEKQVKEFEKSEGESEDDEKEDEGGEEEEDEGVDEKALRSMISKEIDGGIAGKMNEIADDLVSKFMEGVNAQRAKAIDAGKKEVKSEIRGVETRKFFKALINKDSEAIREFSKKEVNTDDDDGAKAGLLIPEELRAEVIRVAQIGYGVARAEMWYLPFSGPGNSRKIPALSAGITVFWTDEGAKKGGTQPTFSIVSQTLKKLACIIPLTEEIIEDSAVDIVGLLGKLFAEAVAKEEDLQFFAGSGSPWTGVLNNSSVVPVPMTAGDVAADITAEDLLDMIDALPAGALAGAKFYFHRTILSVLRKLKDENDNPIFQRATETTPAMIWDFPYVLVEAMPGKTEATASKGIVIFGNLKTSCIVGDKQSIRVKLLDQATITDGDGETVINLAEQDMIALRLEERVGYVVALPSAIAVLKTGASS